mgnify:CR=1 FL=1
MQKKRKIRHVLDKVNTVAVLVILIAGCALDSGSWIPVVLVAVSMIWLVTIGRRGSIKEWLI